MSSHPFVLCLHPAIEVGATAEGYILRFGGMVGDAAASHPPLAVPAMEGMVAILQQMREGGATAAGLQAPLEQQGGTAAAAQLTDTLQEMAERGWLTYAVPPLAVAIPMVEAAVLKEGAPQWSQVSVSLSRFAYQRPHEGGMVLESPLSLFRVRLLDWRASAVLAQLAQPQSLRQLTPPPGIGPETAWQFLNLLWATGHLNIEAEAPALRLWDFHNLLFHSRSRVGSHDYPTVDIASSLEIWDTFGVVKPPMGEAVVSLPPVSIDAICQRDRTLTTAIETRRSICDYDDNQPITLEQLGEFLCRSARIQAIYGLDEDQEALLKAEYGETFDWGELSRRPYPSGGAMYELEIYPLIRHCAGIDSGLYHYDPLNHRLERLAADDGELSALLKDARQVRSADEAPQVLLIVTARFGRLFRKYRSLAYALVLKHVGVLYENFYLVATAMQLAPCALGAGNSDRFARVTGLDPLVESSVGEFMLGSQAMPAALSAASLKASAPTASNLSIDPSTSAQAPASPTFTSSVGPLALHPHDLDDRLPGLVALRNQTLGDPAITIVILDGDPDHTLSCFSGAEISKVFPYWHPVAAPVPREAYLQFQAIEADESLDKEQKAEAMRAVFPDPLLRRIQGDNHACHITSTIVGQEHSPAPGLAPRCRVINLPINTTGDDDEFITELNLARAFELALELGANIIHCAACRPTQTGKGEEILLQALRKCLDHNILIVAPAGNNAGEWSCMPASLPGVLSVGALKPDGTPYTFSNWGGNNALEGVMAPGGDILGAQPANEEPVRLKGTSMAAPVITGLCALLLSLQRQQGKPVDTETVRAALLNTAIPCTADDIDEPERCLRGKVNLPGAMEVLFGPSFTVSFSGEQVTRQEHSAMGTSTITDITPNTVIPSTAHSGLVYALGTIAYDFGDETCRDLFQTAMAPVNRDGLTLPPDPHDARQMVEYLDQHPDQASALIWTLRLDDSTLYVLEPIGPFAAAAYEMFLLMLNGQLAVSDNSSYVDHVSIAGMRTQQMVELLSGEVVPVLKVRHSRGMYGWNVPSLVEAAIATIATPEVDATLLREGLTAFLNRVYHDLRNLGQTSRDRALNFAVTNTFQATATFAEAIASQRQLDTIAVEKSPYCRLNSDCWDVVLTFHDPDDGKRSRQVFHFTVDVADSMPVSVGQIKRWAQPGTGEQQA